MWVKALETQVDLVLRAIIGQVAVSEVENKSIHDIQYSFNIYMKNKDSNIQKWKEDSTRKSIKSVVINIF